MGLYNKDYSILVSILGSPYFGKQPLIVSSFHRSLGKHQNILDPTFLFSAGSLLAWVEVSSSHRTSHYRTYKGFKEVAFMVTTATVQHVRPMSTSEASHGQFGLLQSVHAKGPMSPAVCAV